MWSRTFEQWPLSRPRRQLPRKKPMAIPIGAELCPSEPDETETSPNSGAANVNLSSNVKAGSLACAVDSRFGTAWPSATSADMAVMNKSEMSFKATVDKIKERAYHLKLDRGGILLRGKLGLANFEIGLL